MGHTLTLRHKTQTTHSLCNMKSYKPTFLLRNYTQRYPVTVLLLFCLIQSKKKVHLFKYSYSNYMKRNIVKKDPNLVALACAAPNKQDEIKIKERTTCGSHSQNKLNDLKSKIKW